MPETVAAAAVSDVTLRLLPSGVTLTFTASAVCCRSDVVDNVVASGSPSGGTCRYSTVQSFLL